MLKQPLKFMCEIVFAGTLDIDPNGCANALEEAGYTVHRMAPQHRKLMAHERDEFLDVVGTDDDMDKFWKKVETVIAPFGGDVEGGEIDDTYVPLQFLHDQEASLANQS